MSQECAPSTASNANAGLAFGLVSAAGLSTSIGAVLAFIMPKAIGSTNYFLAASLATAAGVMIYVSFVEIFGVKTVDAIEACVSNEATAYLYASLCFFGGVGLTYLFDIALRAFERCIARRALKHNEAEDENENGSDLQGDTNAVSEEEKKEGVSHEITSSGEVHEDISGPNNSNDTNDNTPTLNNHEIEPNGIESGAGQQELRHEGHLVADLYGNEALSGDRKLLVRMGIFAGIAIAFHNFPEGLATFVAALEDSRVGAAVAIAIGIHNIPEGICVAMPIYYATGSPKKAFFWSTLSGLTELIGAFLGWVVLRKVFNQLVYGILFGIVAGMMVYISVKELLPMANRYDREDKVTTIFLVIGMAVMAASLVLFKY